MAIIDEQLLDILVCPVTKKSLYKGIESMKESNRIGDIGDAIESYIKIHGYGIVRELVGHGLGQSLHELPEVPNYGKKGTGKLIKNGLVLAIEPMINLGTEKIKINDEAIIVLNNVINFIVNVSSFKMYFIYIYACNSYAKKIKI